MSVNQSRTSKVMLLSFGQGLSSVVMLIISVVLARVFSKGDLAVYLQTLLAYSMAAPVLSLGLGYGMYYFLSKELKRAKSIVVEALLILLFMGGAYSLFIALGGNRLLADSFSNPQIEVTLLYMIPFLLVVFPSTLISAVLTVQNSISKLVIYNVLSNLALGAVVVSVSLLWKKPEFTIMGYVGVSIVTGIVAIFMMLRSVPNSALSLDFNHSKRLVSYCFPLALATMLGSIMLQLDKLIVSAMCTPEEFIIYAYGAIEIPVIGMITGSITAVLLSDMAVYCKEGEKDKALELFKKGAMRSALILLPVMAFLMVFADEFISILFTDAFHASVGIFRIYLLTLFVRIVVYSAALAALNMTKVILWRSIGDLLINVLLSLILVYLWGPYGAAFATIITLFVWTVPFNLRAIAQGFGCRWFEVLPITSIGKVMVVSFLSALVSSLLFILVPQLSKISTILLGFFVFGLVYVWLACRYIDDAKETADVLTSKWPSLNRYVKRF